MAQGLRLSTGVELADLDAPPDLSQLNLAEQAARQALSLGPRLAAMMASEPLPLPAAPFDPARFVR